MDAKNLPAVKDITARITSLIEEGQNRVQKSSHNDRSMLGSEILAELESQITSVENIPAAQHPVVETASRDILYPLLVCLYYLLSAIYLTNPEISKYR